MKVRIYSRPGGGMQAPPGTGCRDVRVNKQLLHTCILYMQK